MARKQLWVEHLNWDWKSSPSFKDLKGALEPLGVFVYEDPTFEGVDGYGYLFSNQELTYEQITEICNEKWGYIDE